MDNQITPAAAERSEFEGLRDFVSAPDTALRRKLGIAALLLDGGGGCISVLDDSSSYWTKALGFGFTQSITMDLIRQVTDFYREQGAPMATIQIAPSAIPADWDEICAQEGLSANGKRFKVACETEVALTKSSRGLSTDLRVEPVVSAHAAEWADVMMHQVFGMPPDDCHTAMTKALVGRRGWYPYAVWAGDHIVAAATMYANGETAQFFAGATLVKWRRRGAQTALIAARAQAAHSAGCRWLVSEVALEKPGTHNTSLQNLKRMGFEVLYERTNWTWRATGAATS